MSRSPSIIILFLETIFSIFWYLYFQISDRFIGLVGRVFANGPGDLGSIPGRVIPKTKNGTWYLLA